ncbi:MAG: acetylornithine transaminase [Actinobacteria bacterium]|jgi:acetylornithine aminotransferase|nr:acetylornithine transaminase [Actinomycetota bacterium]
MTTNLELIDQWQSTMQNNYGLPTIALSHGSGAEVWDVEGKRYLDLLGGIATNILGHAHPAVVEAITLQSQKLSHVSNLYAHPKVIELARKLQSFTGEPSARVFFSNSGAEANEAALKLSRLTGRKNIVALEGGFHGRTMGALSMTGQETKRKPFKPLLGKIKFIPFNDLKAAKNAVNKKTAMMIVEPIQGENGVVVPDSGYLAGLREITSNAGALLAIDAVQTGMGRTGTWFGYENEGITPDIITLAKGLGGGLPLGATIAIGSCSTLFQAGSHGSTFGGNPISCAASLAAIAVIENEGLLKRNRDLEITIKLEISKNPIVQTVRGSGLLLGIVLKQDVAKEFVAKLQDKSILANAPASNVIRLAPPLIITDDQIFEFTKAFREVAVGYER